MKKQTKSVKTTRSAAKATRPVKAKPNSAVHTVKYPNKTDEIAMTETAVQPTEPRETKGAIIYRLLSQPQGTTLVELMADSGWLRPSVRGFLSTTGKKQAIESHKGETGDRTYRFVN